MLVHLPNGGPFAQGGSAGTGSSAGEEGSSDSTSQENSSSGTGVAQVAELERAEVAAVARQEVGDESHTI